MVFRSLTPSRAWLGFARGRVLLAPLFGAAVAMACGWLLLDRTPEAIGPLPLAVFGVGYVVTERPVFREVGGDIGKQAPRSIMLAVGLLAISPIELVVTATIAAAIGSAVWNRESVLGVARTMVVVAVETMVAAVLLDTSEILAAGTLSLWIRLTLSMLLAALAGSFVEELDAISRDGGQLTEISTGWARLRGAHLHAAPVMVAATLAVILEVDVRLGIIAALPIPMLWATLRSHIDLRDRYSDLSNIHDFSREVSSESDLVSIAEAAAARLESSTEAAHVVVRLFSPEDGPLDGVVGSLTIPMPNDAACTDRAWRSLFDEGGLREVQGLALEGRIGHNVLAMPVSAEGHILGVVVAADARGGARFGHDDRERIATLCKQLGVVARGSRLHARIRHDATHDRLTGLVNRRYFETWVDEALATEGHGALLLIDLDRFKEINDTFGHQAGDKVLAEGAARIASVIRRNDMAARLGGDEFALFAAAADAETASEIAMLLGQRLEEAFDIGPADVGIGASIGIAIAPDHGSRTTELLRRADAAMYDAKRHRRGSTVYTDSLEEGDESRITLLAELRSVLANQGLEVHYQPQVSLRSAEVVGIEALVRWRHPINGWVRPDQFVELAENSGLIDQLTEQVLARASSDAAGWVARGWNGRLSVNLSTQSLLDQHLDSMVMDILSTSGLAPDRLTLEVTETMMMGDVERTEATLRKLAGWGIKISVDDFGTGYSSLVSLRHLPVSELKIDRSFVMTMMDQKSDDVIVRSTIDLGHNLDLSVVAEGVETPEIAARLSALGCDLAQGFAIAKPMPADELTAWIPAWYARGATGGQRITASSS